MRITPNYLIVIITACAIGTASFVYIVVQDRSEISSAYKKIPVLDRPEDCLRIPNLTDAEMSKCQRRAYFKRIPATPNDNKSF